MHDMVPTMITMLKYGILAYGPKPGHGLTDMWLAVPVDSPRSAVWNCAETLAAADHRYVSVMCVLEPESMATRWMVRSEFTGRCELTIFGQPLADLGEVDAAYARAAMGRQNCHCPACTAHRECMERAVQAARQDEERCDDADV